MKYGSGRSQVGDKGILSFCGCVETTSGAGGEAVIVLIEVCAEQCVSSDRSQACVIWLLVILWKRKVLY